MSYQLFCCLLFFFKITFFIKFFHKYYQCVKQFASIKKMVAKVISRQHREILFVLSDLILYVPSTILELNRDGSSWVKPVLSEDKCVLLKDHNAVTPVWLEPAAPRSRVKHSTTEPLRSLTLGNIGVNSWTTSIKPHLTKTSTYLFILSFA